MKHLKEDKELLTSDYASLASLHEGCSKVISDRNTRLDDQQWLLDSADSIIDNIYYQV